MESRSNRSFHGTALDMGYGSEAHAPLSYYNYQADMRDTGFELDSVEQDRQSSLNCSYQTNQEYHRSHFGVDVLASDNAMNLLQGGREWESHDRHLLGLDSSFAGESSFAPYRIANHSHNQNHWTSTDMCSLSLNLPQAWGTAMMTPPAELNDFGHPYQLQPPMDTFKQLSGSPSNTLQYGFTAQGEQGGIYSPHAIMEDIKVETIISETLQASSPATPASYVSTPKSSTISPLEYQMKENRGYQQVAVAELPMGVCMEPVTATTFIMAIPSQHSTLLPADTEEAEANGSAAPPDPLCSPPEQNTSNFTQGFVPCASAKPETSKDDTYMEPKPPLGNATSTIVKRLPLRPPRPAGSNRTAAKKCRDKTKYNEKQLESREREMASLNMQLKRELEHLVGEVVEWRTKLLIHAHCNNPSINNWISCRAIEISEPKPVAAAQTSSDSRVPSVSPPSRCALRLQPLESHPVYGRFKIRFREPQSTGEDLNQSQEATAATLVLAPTKHTHKQQTDPT